jgi:hypothetical protein
MPEILAKSRAALVAGGVTGPHRSHSRHNVIGKIRAIVEDETDDSFGISGLDQYSAYEILEFVSELMGCFNDIDAIEGYDQIDPSKTVAGIVAGAERLRSSARRREQLFVATGHPTGMLECYMRIADAYQRAGGSVARLREDENIAGARGRHIEVRYVGGVGCVADWGALRHTHSAVAMEALLDNGRRPDVVLGDHGFAGAALERNIPTVAIMDINDPALAVAWAVGKDVVIVPVDDNRLPGAYEPMWTIFELILAGARLE